MSTAFAREHGIPPHRQQSSTALGRSSSAALGAGALQALLDRVDDLEHGYEKMSVLHTSMGGGRAFEDLLDRVDDSERHAEEDVQRLEKQIQGLKHEIISEVAQELQDALVPIQASVSNLAALPPRVAAMEEYRREMDRNRQDFLEVQSQLAGEHEEFMRLINVATSDLKDHAEAIGNMMDMVEKTATHEDLGKALDSSAQEMEELFRGAAADRQSLRETLGRSMSDLDAQVGRLHNETSEKLTDLKLQTNLVLDDHAKAVSTEVDRLDGHLVDFRQEFSGIVSGLEAEYHTNLTEITDKFTDLNVKLTPIVASAPARDDFLQKMSVKMQGLDAKVDSTSQILHQKVELTAEAVDRHLASSKSSLDAKVDKVARESTIRSDGIFKQLKSEQAEERHALEAAIATVQTATERQEARMVSRIDDDTKLMQQRLEKDVDELRGTVEARHKDGEAKTQRHIDAAVKQVKSAVDKLAGMEQNMEQAVTENTEKIKFVNTRFDEFRKQVENQIETQSQSLTGDIHRECTAVQNNAQLENQLAMQSVRSLEEKLSSELSRVTERLEEGSMEQAESLRTVDRKLMDLCAASDSRTNNELHRLSRAIAGLETTIPAAEQKLAQRLDELDATVSSNQSSLANGLASAEAKFGDRQRHHETQLEGARTLLSDRYTRLDSKQSETKREATEALHEAMRGLKDQIMEVRSHVNERTSVVEANLGSRATDLEEKVRGSAASMDQKLDEVAGSSTTSANHLIRLEASVQQVNTAVREVRETAAEGSARMERKWDEQFVARDNSLDELRKVVTNNYSHWASLTAATDTKLRALEGKVGSADRLSNDEREKVAEKLQKLETSGRDDHRQFLDSINSLQSAVGELRTDTDHRLAGLQQQAADLSANVDQKHMEKALTLEIRVRDQQTHHAEAMAAVETQSKAKDAEHDKRFADLTATIMNKTHETLEICHQLGTNASQQQQKNIELIADVVGSVTDVKREAATALAKLEKRQSDTDRQREDQLLEAADAATLGFKRVDAKIEAVETVQGGKLADLQDAVAGMQTAGLTAAAAAEARTKVRLDELADQATAHFDHHRAELETLSERSADATTLVDKKYSSRSTVLLKKLEAMAEQVGLNAKANAAAIAETEGKFGEVQRDVEERIVQQRDVLAGQIKQLKQAQDTRDTAQEKAIEEQHEYFERRVKTVDKELRHELSDQGQTAEQLALTVEMHHEQQTQVSNELLEFVKAENEGQDQRAAALADTAEQHASNAAAASRLLGADLEAAEGRLNQQMDEEVLKLADRQGAAEGVSGALRLEMEADVEALKELDEHVRVVIVEKLALVQKCIKEDVDELVATVQEVSDDMGELDAKVEDLLVFADHAEGFAVDGMLKELTAGM